MMVGMNGPKARLLMGRDEIWGAGPEAQSPPRTSMEPEFWGIERRSANRILKELAGAAKPRPKVLKEAAKKKPWDQGLKAQGGLLDMSLRSSSMAAHEAKEQLEARWGLKYDPESFSSSSLRPVVASGAITPAAQRMLFANDSHDRSVSPAQSMGGMLGMMTVRRSTDALPSSSWRAVFTEPRNYSARRLANQSVDPVRYDHTTGLKVRAESSSSKRLTTSASSMSASGTGSKSMQSMLQVGHETVDPSMMERNVTTLTSKLRFGEAVSTITDLKTIRKFVSKGMGESGVLSLLRIMNKVCTELEEAARREAKTSNKPMQFTQVPSEEDGSNANLFYWLERLRQHRRFVIEENELCQRRPQAVVERALQQQATLPIVFRNASKLVKNAAREAERMIEALKAIKTAPIRATLAATNLATLKASVRELCLDGSMQTSQSDPVMAARFRVLVAEVGKRAIEVRKVLVSDGIPVDEETLHELLRRDEGLFPSAFDFILANQAVIEAKKAVVDLEGAMVRDKELETSRLTDQQARAAKMLAEETELKKIEENECKKEFDNKVLKAKHDKKFVDAIHQMAWEGPCGGANSKALGGAVVMHGSYLYASSDDNDIFVYDVSTTMFEFCKKYRLSGGHVQTVSCLEVLGGHTLFSGGMDNTVCVWDVEFDFALEQVLEGHTGAVSCMAVANANSNANAVDRKTLNGIHLCTGSYDMTIRVWHAVEVPYEESMGRQSQNQSPASMPIKSRSPSTTDTQAANIQTTRDTGNGGTADERRVGRGSPFESALSHPSRAGSPLRRTRVWWQCAHVLIGHGCFIHSIVTDGRFAYSAGEDGLIKVWDVTVKHSIGQLEGCQDSVYALCLRKEAAGQRSGKEMRQLLCSGIDFSVKAWNLNHPSLTQDGIVGIHEALVFTLTPAAIIEEARDYLTKLEHDLEIAVTDDGKKLLGLSIEASKARIGELLMWQSGLQYVKNLICSKNFIYSSGGEHIMRVWSLDLSTCVGTVEFPSKGVHDMTVDAEKDLLGVCCRNNRVYILGTPETASQFIKAKEERENNFAKNGGELWLFDLVTDSARLLLPGIHIRQVSCGQRHGIALDHHGHAWSWGSSERGQCGLGTKDNVVRPQHIIQIAGSVSIEHHQVKAVSAGWFHSLLLMETGVVYACGENDIGQLGLPESDESRILHAERLEQSAHIETLPEGAEKENARRKLEQISAAHRVANLIYTPARVVIGGEEDAGHALVVTSVAAGGKHSVMIDDSGAAWACGLGTHGQLGMQRELQTQLPSKDGYYLRSLRQVKNLDAVTVVSAQASISHTLLLTSQGRVFACGSNASGQLGLGSIAGQASAEGSCLLLPQLIIGLRKHKVTSFAAGANHSIFLSSTNQIYACGAKGATGLPKDTDVPELLQPCVPAGGTTETPEMRHVSASPGGPAGDYSFITTENGYVFVAGATPQVFEPPPNLSSAAPDINREEASVDRALSSGEDGGKSSRAKGDQMTSRHLTRAHSRVRPVYKSENGAAWQLQPVHPVGLVPVGGMARFGEDVAGVQDLNEMVVVLEASCVPFHPSKYVYSKPNSTPIPAAGQSPPPQNPGLQEYTNK